MTLPPRSILRSRRHKFYSDTTRGALRSYAPLERQLHCGIYSHTHPGSATNSGIRMLFVILNSLEQSRTCPACRLCLIPIRDGLTAAALIVWEGWWRLLPERDSIAISMITSLVHWL